MSVSVFSTGFSNLLRVEASWLDAQGAHSFSVLWRPEQFTKLIKDHPHAWVTYN